jgi:hypothetical protein
VKKGHRGNLEISSRRMEINQDKRYRGTVRKVEVKDEKIVPEAF